MNIAATHRLLPILQDADSIRDAAAAKAGGSISCKEGCSWCCHHLVPATLPEVVIALMGAIASGHQKQVNRPKKIIDDAQRATKVSGNKEWYRLKRPCLFLTKMGRCSVYEFRPVACRSYVSLDDPDRCRDGKEIEASVGFVEALRDLKPDLEDIAVEMQVPGDRKTLQEWLPRAAALLDSVAAQHKAEAVVP